MCNWGHRIYPFTSRERVCLLRHAHSLSHESLYTPARESMCVWVYSIYPFHLAREFVYSRGRVYVWLSIQYISIYISQESLYTPARESVCVWGHSIYPSSSRERVCVLPRESLYTPARESEYTDTNRLSRESVRVCLRTQYISIYISRESLCTQNLVGSLKLHVSFVEYSLFDRDLLQKRPMYTDSLARVSVYSRERVCVCLCVSLGCMPRLCVSLSKHRYKQTYGVATISMLLKMIGLFCKRALWNRLYSTNEKYNFKEQLIVATP